MSELTKKIQNAGQKLVSGDKYRYKADGFDLDLAYILPRVIAMAIPGEGIEKNWRNNINDVSRFLNGKHGPDYRIFNLTGEEYDYGKFNHQVVDHFDFPDHHPPCLRKYLAVIKAIDEWMLASSAHVAVVHCLAGRSRTGCVIAGYLMYSSLNGSATSSPLLLNAQDAINHFNFVRSYEGLNIVLPSQIRWVTYLEKILKEKRYDLVTNPPKFLLKSVRLAPPPLVEGEKKKAALTPITCVKYLAESAKDGRAPITDAVHPQLWRDDPPTDLKINAEVAGDVEIIFYHNAQNSPSYTATMSNLYSRVQTIQMASKYPRVPLFRYIFNTGFLTGNKLVVNVDDLDAPMAGAVETNEYIQSDMTVTFDFEKLSDTSDVPAPAPAVTSDQVMHKVSLIPNSVLKVQSGKANPSSAPSSFTSSHTKTPSGHTTENFTAALDAAVATTHAANLARVASMTTPNVLFDPPKPSNGPPNTDNNPSKSWASASHSPTSSAQNPLILQPSRPLPTANPSIIIAPEPQSNNNATVSPRRLSPNAVQRIASSPTEIEPSHNHRRVQSDVPGHSLIADIATGRKSPTPSPNRSPRGSTGSAPRVSTGSAHIPVGIPIVNPETNPFATDTAVRRRISDPLHVPSVAARRISDPLKPYPSTNFRPTSPQQFPPPSPQQFPPPSHQQFPPSSPQQFPQPISPISQGAPTTSPTLKVNLIPLSSNTPPSPASPSPSPQPYPNPLAPTPPTASAIAVALVPLPPSSSPSQPISTQPGAYPGLPNLDPTRQPPSMNNNQYETYQQYLQSEPVYPQSANYTYPQAQYPQQGSYPQQGGYPQRDPYQYAQQGGYQQGGYQQQGAYPQQQPQADYNSPQYNPNYHYNNGYYPPAGQM